MAIFSYSATLSYAKSSGHKLRRVGQRYLLETCYGDYTCTNLQQVQTIIRKTNARLESARF